MTTSANSLFDIISWNTSDVELENVGINNEVHPPDQTIELLRNITIMWNRSTISPDIINIIYIDHLEQPEIVKYNISDLSDALKVLGAISTYYQQNVRNKLTTNQEQEIKTLLQVDQLPELIPMIKLLNMRFMFDIAGLVYINSGVYAVELN